MVAGYRSRRRDGLRQHVAAGAAIDCNRIAPAARSRVERIAGALGLNDAGFDVAVVDDGCYVPEFNLLSAHATLNAHGIRLGPEIAAWLARQDPPDNHAPRPMPPRAC